MSKKEKKKKKLTQFKGSILHLSQRLFEKNPEKAISFKEVCSQLAIKDNELRTQCFEVLKELSLEGYLLELPFGKYQLNQHVESVVGEIQITANKAGFLLIEEGKDIYISSKNTFQAMNGDTVKVLITKKGKERTEGKVIEIVERGRSFFVGFIEKHSKFAFFIPDNQKSGVDIYIPLEKLKGANDKDRVLAKINVWPKSSKNPYGEVVEVLTSKNANDNEMLSILCAQGIPFEFPNEVIKEAENVSDTISEENISYRKDFRKKITFTIDPVDAKDFDDAISFEKLENGHLEIGVHIADVSHYVLLNSAMDKEAMKRGNSVYLVDRVIPMLPEQLSNIVCSLRPHEEKLTFSAVFEIDENGKVYEKWFGKTVIYSDRRFTYEEAQEIIEGKEGDYKEELLMLNSIAQKLRKERIKNGALEIESEELRFTLDKKGNPNGVIVKKSKEAHKLIEEFMLLANRSVAEHIAKKKTPIPFVYRCHDTPDLAKMEVFKIFIDKFNYKLDFSHPKQIAQSINRLLNDIKEKNEYSIIQNMAIRSMAKAYYDSDNIGHYGLSFHDYTHFTSPIRRYADLLVHRILWEEITHTKVNYGQELKEKCKHISKTERKANEAERDSSKYFQALFMKDKLGIVFSGTISGLSDFGIFVKINENACEGLVAFQEMNDDRYYFDQSKYMIVGSRFKKEYHFGDTVDVLVTAVDMRKRQISMEIV
ncbi:MAG: ribonuclease R [Flavobacteriia bacterium]|nr:ribonuclease R [Flavobacteriia bacterium]